MLNRAGVIVLALFIIFAVLRFSKPSLDNFKAFEKKEQGADTAKYAMSRYTKATDWTLFAYYKRTDYKYSVAPNQVLSLVENGHQEYLAILGSFYKQD